MTTRYRSRSTAPRRRDDGTRANRYAGPCALCGHEVPAEHGNLRLDRDGRYIVVHRPPVWSGSPTSGQWIGGCPEEVAS